MSQCDSSMMMFVSRGMMRVGHPVVLVDDRRPDFDGNDLVDVVGQTALRISRRKRPDAPGRGGRCARGAEPRCVLRGAVTQFNAFPRPAVVLADRGRHTVVKRRETLQDVLERESHMEGEGWETLMTAV